MMPAPPPGGMPPQGPPPPPPGAPPTPNLWDRFMSAVMARGPLAQAAGGAPPPNNPAQLQDAVTQYMLNLQKTNSPAGPIGPGLPPMKAAPKSLGEPPKKKKSPRASATRSPKPEDY